MFTRSAIRHFLNEDFAGAPVDSFRRNARYIRPSDVTATSLEYSSNDTRRNLTQALLFFLVFSFFFFLLFSPADLAEAG